MQNGESGGIINSRGDNNVISNERAIGGSYQESFRDYIGGTQEGARFTKENSVAFERRTKEILGASRKRLVIGKNTLAYKTTVPDSSEAGTAYNALKSIGVNVVFCDGPIFRNNGTVTTQSVEALTTPDSTVYISNQGTLKGIETAFHELVHVAQNTNNAAFVEYKLALTINVDISSNSYISIAKKINKNHFNEKYDIFDSASWNYIVKELSAYINQYVMTDPTYAQELFGGMFRDWSAVTAAVEKFNKDMGADFSESALSVYPQATSNEEVASFMPENEQSEVFENGEETGTPETENPESEEFEEDFEEENGSFFDEPSAEFPKPNLIEDIGAKAAGVTRYSDGQRLIMRIGKNLGYKVVFDPELKTKMGATSNGKIDFDNKIIYLNPAVSKPLQFIFGHEITHFGTASETFEEFIEPIRKTNLYLKWLQRKTGSASSSVGLLEGLYRERVMESRKNADPMGAAEAQEEMYADFCGETFFSDGEKGLTHLLNSLEGKKRSKVMQFILDFVSYLKEKLSGNKDITFQIIRLESKFADLLKSAKENTAHNSGVKYSFEGYAQDGKGKYKSNFPKGTPKSAKSERILNYIKNVWSKKPIRLKIENNGEIRYIEAKFDPAYDETGNTPTDASKLMGGNRHGTSSEQRVTLDLADDYYQIASESTYNYSKDETGKNNPTHNDVTKWHYFVNDIYFSELDSNEYIPYRVTINVKERSDGDFVYSFSAEKTEKLSTPRTLHAVVNEGNNSNANAQLSNNKLSQKQPVVKNKYMQKKEKHSISLDERAENDTETDSDIGDIPSAMEELMQQYQNGDFGEDIFRARMDEIYNEALNRFGVIPEGENAETPISVPQKISDDKITRRFVRTILETGKLTADMIADVEGEILLGDMMSYEEVSNETAMKRADRSFERGTAEADWHIGDSSLISFLCRQRGSYK